MKCCCCEKIHTPDPDRIHLFPESTSIDICDFCFVEIILSNIDKEQMEIKALRKENALLRKLLGEK